MLDTTKAVTCNACGWVHVAVTREYAEAKVAEFNAFYAQESPEMQEMYGGPASMDHYLHCDRCWGPHTNFRVAQPGDCPQGCTLGPIVQ